MTDHQNELLEAACVCLRRRGAILAQDTVTERDQAEAWRAGALAVAYCTRLTEVLAQGRVPV